MFNVYKKKKNTFTNTSFLWETNKREASIFFAKRIRQEESIRATINTRNAINRTFKPCQSCNVHAFTGRIQQVPGKAASGGFSAQTCPFVIVRSVTWLVSLIHQYPRYVHSPFHSFTHSKKSWVTWESNRKVQGEKEKREEEEGNALCSTPY